MTPAKFLIDGVLVLTFLAGVAFFARGLAAWLGSTAWAVRWADEVTEARRKAFEDEKATALALADPRALRTADAAATKPEPPRRAA